MSEHGAQAPPATRHSSVAPGSPANASCAPVSVVEPVGPAMIVGAAGRVVSTVQVCVATGDWLLAASVWRISTVCWPSVRPVSCSGELHGTQAPPSTWHSNVAPPSPVNAIDGLASLLSGAGADVRSMPGAAGAPVSTVHVCVAGVASALPTASLARTCTVWGPSASGE